LVDQYGKLSVLGIWRHLMVGQFPGVHPRAHLVVHLRGRRTEIGSHQVVVQLLDPTGATLLEQSGMMEVNEPPAGVMELDAPLVLIFDVPLSVPGEYAFLVVVDGTEVARVAFAASLPAAAPGGTVH
jgi:hypothetical protein